MQSAGLNVCNMQMRELALVRIEAFGEVSRVIPGIELARFRDRYFRRSSRLVDGVSPGGLGIGAATTAPARARGHVG